MRDTRWPTDLKSQQGCAMRFNEVVRSRQAAEATTKLPSEVLESALKPCGDERSAICQEMLADKLQGQRQFSKEWFRTGNGKKRMTAAERYRLHARV